MKKNSIKNKTEKVINEEMNLNALVLSGGDGDLQAYTKKVEEFLKEIHGKADDLATEGEKMIRENYLRVAAAEERKRSVLVMVGYMRQVRNTIGNLLRLRYLIG